MRYKRIIDPIYDAEVHCIAGCNANEREKKLKKIYKDLEDKKESKPSMAQCFGLLHSDGYKNYVVWFETFNPKKAKTLYIIVREASHLVDKIFEDKGVGNDTETRAYYLKYWVRELWRFCGNGK